MAIGEVDFSRNRMCGFCSKLDKSPFLPLSFQSQRLRDSKKL